MRRRNFFQAAIAATAFGVFRARDTIAAVEFDAGVLALAETIAPASDPETWGDSEVAAGLLYELNLQDGRQEREHYEIALEKLEKSSLSRTGKTFTELDRTGRTDVVRELLSSDETFGDTFAAIREDVIRIYFGSGDGMRFSGYRQATQFAGYPEMLESAENWE